MVDLSDLFKILLYAGTYGNIVKAFCDRVKKTTTVAEFQPSEGILEMLVNFDIQAVTPLTPSIPFAEHFVSIYKHMYYLKVLK